MSVQWEVTYLRIHADPAGTSLFANGQMQVAANILIKAIDPTNNADYNLTPAELASIQLVDYYNTEEVLTGNWTYTTIENDFSHTMPSNGFSRLVQAPMQSSMVDQYKKYWVSTTKSEVKSVGARILQPDKTWVTTRTSPNDSSIVFRSTPEIKYSLANCEWWREDTASGSGWDQDNYFLRSKVHPFKVAERHAYRNENYEVVGMRNSVAYHRAGPHLHYMWPLGPPSTQNVGLTNYTDGRPHPNPWTKNIVIRQHTDSLCLTRMITSGPKDIWSQGWWYNPWVEMFDLYGNRGSFNFAVNEYNTISVSNRVTD
ncbi:hypothetical protein DID88_006788 [Monilinia fructigena]|uniref:Uncharacterized protein n=1 Tax=Monilinia fructigena TaxID=38457 RepID=A0A395IHP2_9HELO|nr:hypothetical protein DID88_006788 [Monilinia fructigena]